MLEKIEDYEWRNEKDYCTHAEHNPPMHIVLGNGKYKHICPSCGKVTVFSVRNPTLCVI